jgi:hypothetical protein
VEGVRGKAKRFFLPARTDELVNSQSRQCFEPLGKIVSVDEALQVLMELLMRLVVVVGLPLNCRQ